MGLFAETSQAQVRWYRPGPYALGVGTGAYLGGYGYRGGLGGYSPSLGYGLGMAAVTQARGQAAKDYAQARISYEDARSKYLDNKLKWTKVYWQRKNYAEAQIQKEWEEDQAARLKWLASRRDRKPETLPPSQYDVQSGEVQWPQALQAPVYTPYREQIEEELDARASGTANEAKIRSLARQMQSELKNHIREMDSTSYIAARKFLDRMVNQMALAQAS